MGSYPMQARGLILFLLAFVVLAGAFAAGGRTILLAVAMATLFLAVAVFLKCKRWEQEGDSE